MFLSRGDRDLGVAFQTHPGRQAFISSGSKEPRSALESRRVSLGAHWVDSRESSLLRRLERGRLSRCIWNLAFISERRTEKLPLRVDFIHRVEFGEVSGHRVLIKRGPGNRGPTECGTTHEATSGMSS